MVSLEALAWEAGRRGISYGELVAHLHPGEELDIAARYRAYQDEKRYRAAERAAKKAAEKPKRRKKKKEET